MTRDETIFLWVFILNALIAVGYLLHGCFVHTNAGEGVRRRTFYVLRFACMILCPVIGALYFGLSGLLQKCFFHREDEIAAIEFSKARIRQRAIPNEEDERELLPIQEALLVSTPEELRSLMLTVLKRDDLIYLRTVALAVRSEDSETAHYAGSLLSKAVNAFRGNIQAEKKELSDAERDEQENTAEQHDLAVRLVKDMNFLLQQHLLSQIEQELMTKDLVHAGELAWQAEQEQNREKAFSLALGASEYSGISMRLIDIQAYEDADLWCKRAMEACPDEAESYKCLLRLKYQTGDVQGFLDTIARLMETRIRIDQELMDLIRLFKPE